ncbi:MAG: DNA primase [Bacillota bacterium]
MSGRIPEEFISDLRHRVDIVEIIREYLPLRKQGNNFIGLCPFHQEKTPSFVVSPQKQIYHCFGCGKGGNVFSFLMEKNSLSYPEAVLYLAKRCGITMPENDVSPEKARQEKKKQRYYEINEFVTQYYHRLLFEGAGKEALLYLERRGLSQDSCEKFLLGYAPQTWDQLTRLLLDKKVLPEELLILGLASKAQNGNLIDRFRNRLMFPICDERGRVVGFGGRVLDDSLPKYLNSPDTPLFSKGRFLYGLNLAKGPIRTQDQVIIMEGYMDVITAHQHGISNAVATLGTALTTEQARMMMRYTYNTATCFDADSAGQEATLRGLDILRQLGCHVSVVTIPDGKDPDEFLNKQGREAFLKRIQEALPLLEYKLQKMLEKYDASTVNGKIQVVQGLIPDLHKVQSPVARQGFIQLLADKLGFPEVAIHAEIRKYQKGEAGPNTGDRNLKLSKNKFVAVSATAKAERTLIRLAVEIPEITPQIEEAGGIELFTHNSLKEIYQLNLVMRQAGHNIKANDLMAFLEAKESQEILAEILMADELPQDWERALRDCLTILELEYINRKIQEKSNLMIQCEQKGDISKSQELMAHIQQLVINKQRLIATLRKGGNGFEN